MNRARSGARRPRAQRGFAMIAILSLFALITAYFIASQLGASINFIATDRKQSAKALNRAKQALIGYVAQQAAEAGENNPGRLPCPELPGNFGTTNEGIAAGNCTLPAVGRLPWRTLGLDKLVDAAGEPLWYVVSPGWALSNSTTPPLTTDINSNSPGQLTVDGVLNDSVALIIAPGQAFIPLSATGCAARTQVRTTSGAPDLRNYLECENATGTSFVTTGKPTDSFNDQVLRVTTADLMPEIEAAIAVRIQREIVPVLKSVYASAQWGLSTTNPLFPFAAPFTNPGTSNYQGTAGTSQGLLPFTYSQACNPLTDSRCSTTFVVWNTAVTPTVTATNGIIIGIPTCTVTTTTAQCNGVYAGLVGQTVLLNMTARAKNVAMTLKSIDSTQTAVRYGTGSLGPSSPGTGTGAFRSDGAANMVTTGGVPGFDTILPLNVNVNFRITANIAMLDDHWILSSSDPPPSNSPATCPTTTPSLPNYWCTGWFVRNEWYRLVYFASAPGHTAAVLPTLPSCTNGVDCLSVTNVAPTNKQRAILILAGRSLTNPAGRPNGTLADYLEFGNADGNTAFEQQPISTVINPALKKPFNDRIVVLDANP